MLAHDLRNQASHDCYSGIELGEITMKVPLAAMLIDTLHAALEHTVAAFDGVRVHIRHARIHRPYG